MHDLSLLKNNEKFALDVESPRLAFVHHGFKITQLDFVDKPKPEFSPKFASLGLLNLARSLQVDFENKKIPFSPEMKYFDEDSYQNDDELSKAIIEWLQPSKARFILAGLYTIAVERTEQLLSKIDPSEFCIVVGGPHPTVAPYVDYAHIVVRGEGGIALRHILNNLLQPTFGQGSEARGLCFKLDGNLHMSGTAFDNSLAKIPPPAFAYELNQSKKHAAQQPRVRWWTASGNSPQIYICTQGCRARCTFCSTYLIHGHLVSRPAKFIEADIDYMIDEFGTDSIHFHDDDLLQHEQFNQLMEILTAKKVTWTCNARSEFMTHELAQQMFAAGCRRVFLGVESLDQKSLDYYRKETTVEMNQNALINLDAAGIGVICGYIIGAPHDNLESSLSDLDRILDLPIYFLSTAILTPDIGTVEYVRAKKKNSSLQLLGDKGTKFNLKPRPDIFGAAPPYGLPTVCDFLSKGQLNEIYELVNCEFFLRRTTFERIKKLTLPSRLDDVYKWYEWIFKRADKLTKSARLIPIQKRANNLMSNQEIYL